MKMASNYHTPHQFKEQEHANSIMKQVYDCWKKEKYSDVILNIDGHLIKSNKVVLASFSDYFQRLFDLENIGMYSRSKDGTEIYVLRNVNWSSFQLLLNFAYTGQVDLTAENAQDLLICADYFGIFAVRHACEDFMSTNIATGNCINLMNFADAHSLSRLESSLLDHIGNCFETFMETDEFVSLKLEVFIKLLKNKGLVILRNGIRLSAETQELYLLRAALRYAKSKPETSREDILSSLLKDIRLQLIDQAALAEELAHWQELTSFPSIKLHIELAVGKICSSPGNNSVPNYRSSGIKLSGQSIILGRRRLADGNKVGLFKKPFKYSGNIGLDDRIQQIIIWVRKWEEKNVLSGLEIKYNSGKFFTYGGKAISSSLFVGEYIADLRDNEVITKVTGSHGWMVDSLTFHTNLGRILDPFGGAGGKPFSISFSEEIKAYTIGNDAQIADSHNDAITNGYLHSFEGQEVFTQNEIAITHLGFVWVKCKTATLPTKNVLLVHAPESKYPKRFRCKLIPNKFFL